MDKGLFRDQHGSTDQETMVWLVSFVIMFAAIMIQLVRCIKRSLCLSDEDYIREYFSELELSERLDLTPVPSDPSLLSKQLSSLNAS